MALPLTESETRASLDGLDTFRAAKINSPRFDVEVGEKGKVVSWQKDAETGEWVSK
jgi:hypothetical protein